MIFYYSEKSLTKKQVSEQPWLAKWTSIQPESHNHLAELLSHPYNVGCSLGDVSNSNLQPSRIFTASTAKSDQFFRSSNVIDKITNVLLLDIEVSSTLEDWIDPPLDSQQKVIDFCESLNLTSYILGRSSSSITKDNYFKWHVYALFDQNISMSKVSNFIQHKVPKDSWFVGLTSNGQEVIKNSYLDTSVFAISRLIYEHPTVDFYVKDEGLNPYNLISGYTKPFTPNPFTLQRAFPDQEQFRRSHSFNSKHTSKSRSKFKNGFFTPDTILTTDKGETLTVEEIIETTQNNIRLHSLIDDHGGGMAYYPSSQTFIDYHDDGKRYIMSKVKDKLIEYTTQYLPTLDLSQQNTFILAPTGSGKTTQLKRQIEGPTIFIVPTKAIVKDQDGMTSGFSRWSDLRDDKINVMTFNKLAGHLYHNKNISKYNIVIDEVHRLFSTHETSEYQLLYKLLLLRQEKFKKLVLLSATMEADILPVENLYSFKYINVSKKTNIQFLKNVTDVDTLISGRTLIFQQSKMLNASIADRYSKTHKVLNLKSGSEIPKDLSQYDIIITTSVLREGFSITSHIDTVLLYNVKNSFGVYDIIQSIARPRINQPEIKIVSASTHFTDTKTVLPTLASLRSAASELAKGYLPTDLRVLHAINLEQFKRMCLMLDNDEVVINDLGIMSYYLDIKSGLELRDFSLMTKHLKEYLHCDTQLIKMSEEDSELPQITLKELQIRLKACKTFEELEKVIKIVEDVKDYAAQASELLDKIQDTKTVIDTKDGVLYLSEEQQVQYKVNTAVFSRINQHKKNINEGVYEVLNTNRAWKYKDTFEIRGLKRIFKILDKNKKKFSDDDVMNILRKVCRFEKTKKDGTVVKRGDFDLIRVTHRTLMEIKPYPKEINITLN